MTIRPLYVAEKVPARFVGGAFSHLPWHVVLIGTDASRSPAGRARDGHGRRYKSQREASEAALREIEAQTAAAAVSRPTPAADEAIAWLEGRR
jgi:hypothetical protein